MKCLEKCRINKKPCDLKACRMWIDYKEDYNCVQETVRKNGDLTLRETADRLNISFVRVKQIEKVALSKLEKRLAKLKIGE